MSRWQAKQAAKSAFDETCPTLDALTDKALDTLDDSQNEDGLLDPSDVRGAVKALAEATKEKITIPFREALVEAHARILELEEQVYRMERSTR